MINRQRFLVNFPNKQENETTEDRNGNVTGYYEHLRNNVITMLEHVKMPSPAAGRGCCGSLDNNNNKRGSSDSDIDGQQLAKRFAGVDSQLGQGRDDVVAGGQTDHFDNYLSKLQSLCSSQHSSAPHTSPTSSSSSSSSSSSGSLYHQPAHHLHLYDVNGPIYANLGPSADQHHARPLYDTMKLPSITGADGFGVALSTPI
ncbi:hypothetical protein ZHAS_00009636 [Anopheles sinensis]|uniref:Uncharacterized protein n=1 Tax=Anopheles sinensis TaxID=74873 RepID=A0A084VVQ9_ANOSI|nr:hypothetical protein ZHAS_00009636 [Anopheles sinensis]